MPPSGFRSWAELGSAARTDAVIPSIDDAVSLVVLFGRAPTLPERVAFARARSVDARRVTTSEPADAMLASALRTMVDAWTAISERVPDGAARRMLVSILDEAARTAAAAHRESDALIALHRARAAHVRARDALSLAMLHPR